MLTLALSLAGSPARAVPWSGTTPPEAPPFLTPTHYELDLAIELEKGTMEGHATIDLVNAGTRPVGEANFLLYRLLAVREASSDGVALAHAQRVVSVEDAPKRQVNHVTVRLPRDLEPGQGTRIRLDYGGYLLGYAETDSPYIRDRIDAEYTLLREDAEAYPTVRFPSMRWTRAMGFPEFGYLARITVPASHTVAAGGELVERSIVGDKATFVYRSLRPSWRMDFAVARFEQLARGSLRVHHLPEDRDGARRLLDAMERCLDLFTAWRGPLAARPQFSVIEIPAGWGSQADATVILQSADAFRDPTRTRELYHELSHLWDPRSSDRPAPRLEEGLASYLEILAAERLDGSPPAAEVLAARWGRLRRRVEGDPRLLRVALRDYGRESMTDHSYVVGSLFFDLLRQLAGPERFERLLAEHHRAHAGSAASIADFARLARESAPGRLDRLIAEWLESPRWAERVAGGETRDEFLASYP